MIFRRFSHLQARLILQKQDEIRELEDELRESDLDDLAKMPPGQPSRRLTTRHRTDKTEADARKKLFDRLEQKFLQYGNVVTSPQVG